MRKLLGKLELRVMNLIWNISKATVRDIWEKLYPERGLAYTTVATVMRNLEEKGFLRHNEIDRTYVYYPIVNRKNVSQGMLRELVDGLFDRSAAKLIVTLIQDERLNEEDLNQIEQAIIKHRKGNKNG